MLMPLRFILLQKVATLKVVTLLLQYNAAPDKPKSDGATPLYVASY